MGRSFLFLGFLLFACSLTMPEAVAPKSTAISVSGGGKGRALLGYKEIQGNASFQCSPSGPCIPCQYSEKNDEKYRCSETGYRVPLKCIEIQDSPKEKTDSKNLRKLYSKQDHEVNAAVHKQLPAAIRKLRWRSLLDDSSTSEDGKQSYITYRSCVPMDGEEKLSVLGFENPHNANAYGGFKLYFKSHICMKACAHGLKREKVFNCLCFTKLGTSTSCYEFEKMIMVGLLLISGPVVYMRQKRSFVMPGVGALRTPSNSLRF